MPVAKKKMGRPEVEIDTDLLEKIASMPVFIMSNTDIAWLIGVSLDSLERFVKKTYGVTFAVYREQKKSWIRSVIYRTQIGMMLKGDRTMAIWLGKNYLNQSDQMSQVVHQTTVDFSKEKLSEQYEKIENMMKEIFPCKTSSEPSLPSSQALSQQGLGGGLLSQESVN